MFVSLSALRFLLFIARVCMRNIWHNSFAIRILRRIGSHFSLASSGFVAVLILQSFPLSSSNRKLIHAYNDVWRVKVRSNFFCSIYSIWSLKCKKPHTHTPSLRNSSKSTNIGNEKNSHTKRQRMNENKTKMKLCFDLVFRRILRSEILFERIFPFWIYFSSKLAPYKKKNRKIPHLIYE